ncbi:hypothetical protein ABS71_15165 [bacterium SCN 62-11]|nr:MAG: hypothetical protein ABS71_15165 [bacterium SCN 62-11]
MAGRECEGPDMRFLVLALLLAGVAAADTWHTLRAKSIKGYTVEWSDPKKGSNGYHVDCFSDEQKTEWLGGLTFYLKDGPTPKTVALKDLEGLNLRSPVKPLSAGGRSVLKMVKEFTVTGNQIHFLVQGKDGEWDVDLKADLKIN